MNTKKKIVLVMLTIIIVVEGILIGINYYNKLQEHNKPIKAQTQTISDDSINVFNEDIDDLEKKVSKLEEQNNALTTQVAGLTSVVSDNSIAISNNEEAVERVEAKKIVGIHNVNVSVGTDWNVFLDELTADVGGEGQVIPITDDVDLNEPGTYTVHWTLDDVAEDTSTVTVH